MRFGLKQLPFDVGARPALGLLACAGTALVYQSTLDLPFVFDDRTTILLNPALTRAWDVRAAIVADIPRAAVTLSYAMDRAFWGFSSFGYHLTNTILHIIVVALFYGTCTRALSDAAPGRPQVKPKRKRKAGDPSRQSPGLDWAAFFAAAAFGLHPVMSATALYVSARTELICAAAFMIALMFARRAILTSSTAPALLAIGFGAIALGASPAGAALPVVLLAYDLWLIGKGDWRRRLRRVYAPAIAMVVAALALGLHGAPPFSLRLLENVLTESIVFWRYFALLVMPWGEAAVHDARRVASLVDPVALLSIAAIAAAIAVTVRLRRTAPLASIGLIWFCAALAASSFLVAGRDAMAESRVYLPAAGLMLAAFAAAAPALAARRAPRIGATAILAILAVLTSMRARVWSDPMRLWTEAVERSPASWQAHLEFSETLKEAGRCDRATEEFSAARRLKPQLPPDPATGWAPCPAPRRGR